jgi:hypothetical protein
MLALQEHTGPTRYPLVLLIATSQLWERTPVIFQSKAGYHDHNWGGLGLLAKTRTWYWGHATVGPYSLLWFDALAYDNTRWTFAYLVNNGNVLLSTPNTHQISVLPSGNGTSYPPPNNGNNPTGFTVNFSGDHGERWSFCVQSQRVAVNQISPTELYTRWTGTISGGQLGHPLSQGSGVWEWVRL